MNRENEMVIEAGFGLGQLITKGEVTPDLYLLDGNLKVKEEVIGKKKLKLIKEKSCLLFFQKEKPTLMGIN